MGVPPSLSTLRGLVSVCSDSTLGSFLFCSVMVWALASQPGEKNSTFFKGRSLGDEGMTLKRAATSYVSRLKDRQIRGP